jgi:hypothetical protein
MRGWRFGNDTWGRKGASNHDKQNMPMSDTSRIVRHAVTAEIEAAAVEW